MAQVFLSFIHEEQRVAEAIQDLLRETLVTQDVFLSSDQWQVFAGEIWLDRIKEALNSARVVVLLLSKKSVERPWVNFEAGAAWGSDTPIVPVCYGGLNKGALPKPYSGIQALEIPDEVYYLARSVQHHLQPGSLAPASLPRLQVESKKKLAEAIEACTNK
jgi:hypothetical protein